MVVTILSVIQVIACLFLIVTILLQKAPSQGLSSVYGQQETFFGSNKATGIEAILGNLTKIFGVIFVLDSLILVLLG